MKIARSILPNVGLSAVLVALAFPAAVAAAAHDLTELPLEDLLKVEVVSASKYPQAGAAAPSAVTVVSREDIRRFGWRTLSELLGAQRGFHSGVKLCRSSMVARQLNKVATKIGRPSAPAIMSWTAMSPVV